MMARFLVSAVALVSLLAVSLAQGPQTPAITQSPTGFLYLEEHRIRFEVMVPLRQLDAFYPASLDDAPGWTPELQAKHRSAISTILQSHMHITVNGRESTPLHSSLVFLDMRAPMESSPDAIHTVDFESGAVGMIVQYAAPSRPSSYEVDAMWDGFNLLLSELPVRVYSDADTNIRILTPRHNRLLARYHFSGGPSSSASRMDQTDPIIDDAATASVVLERLLASIYRAFDYARDEDVYDALARAVTGDLLSRVYLDIRRSLAMEQEGGATARVDKIRIVSVRMLEAEGASTVLHATWRITGTVEHWGHIHERTNEYSARIGLERLEDRYFIKALTIERHDRIGDEFSVRDAME